MKLRTLSCMACACTVLLTSTAVTADDAALARKKKMLAEQQLILPQVSGYMGLQPNTPTWHEFRKLQIAFKELQDNVAAAQSEEEIDAAIAVIKSYYQNPDYAKLVLKSELENFKTSATMGPTKSEIQAVWRNSLNRIYPAATPIRSQDLNGMRISAARNESECSQLYLLADKDLHNIRFTVSSLPTNASGATIAPENIKFYLVGNVTTTDEVPYDTLITGEVPDVLQEVDCFSLPAATRAALLVEVKIPAKQQPGNYLGEILITADELNTPEKAHLGITVWNFTIPEKSSLDAVVSLDLQKVAAAYPAAEQAQRQTEFEAMLAAHRLKLAPPTDQLALPPACGRLLDHPATAIRLLPGFMAHKFKYPQLHLGEAYALNDSLQDPALSTSFQVQSPRGNGAENLLYAGKNGPMASLRLKQLRDGLEDYEYLKLIQKVLNAAEAKQIRLTKAQKQQFQDQLNIAEDLITAEDCYTLQPAILLDTRDSIGDQLNELTN